MLGDQAKPLPTTSVRGNYSKAVSLNRTFGLRVQRNVILSCVISLSGDGINSVNVIVNYSVISLQPWDTDVYQKVGGGEARKGARERKRQQVILGKIRKFSFLLAMLLANPILTTRNHYRSERFISLTLCTSSSYFYNSLTYLSYSVTVVGLHRQSTLLHRYETKFDPYMTCLPWYLLALTSRTVGNWAFVYVK